MIADVWGSANSGHPSTLSFGVPKSLNSSNTTSWGVSGCFTSGGGSGG